MKKITFVMLLLIFSGAVMAQNLSKEDRKAAIKYIKWTNKELKNSLKGMSTGQLNFKASPESWSAQDCLYHIAFSEGTLRTALDEALKTPADAAAKAEIQMTDDQVKSVIMDRSNKVKTATPFEPQNTGFTSYDEAMAAFKAKRTMLIGLVKNKDIELRNHVAAMPFGKLNGYQFVLFIAAHSNRHTQQINEVKTAAGYPQS